MILDKHLLPVIIGPTASGKTKLAAKFAYEFDGEIISADSRQVYKGMDIGTGKDLGEYTINNKNIPYHLIDIIDAGADYHIHTFQKDFIKAYRDIKNRHKLPVLCGGTGLYIQSVLQKYQLTNIPVNEKLKSVLSEKSHEELIEIFKKGHQKAGFLPDLSTKKRTIRAIEISTYLHKNQEDFLVYPDFEPIVFGIDINRDERRKRISERLKHRLSSGMIEEVESLLQSGIPKEKLIFYGLEYKLIVNFLDGDFDKETLFIKLETAIHQYAKRQMTYFRKMEKDGLFINWIEGSLAPDEQLNSIKQHLKAKIV